MPQSAPVLDSHLVPISVIPAAPTIASISDGPLIGQVIVTVNVPTLSSTGSPLAGDTLVKKISLFYSYNILPVTLSELVALPTPPVFLLENTISGTPATTVFTINDREVGQTLYLAATASN